MIDLHTYYVLHCITENGKLCDGMYRSGERAATPDLAKRMWGNLTRQHHKEEPTRLCVLMVHALPGTWTDSAGNAHQRYDKPIVVEIEPQIGDWNRV